MAPPTLLRLSLLLLSFLVSHSQYVPPPPLPSATLIDCGATTSSVIDGRLWLDDTPFVSSGTPRNLISPDGNPVLSTVRTFPLQNKLNRKFCYDVPIIGNTKYMIRTSYYYYGRDTPPVFDQIIDGAVWGVVNTTEDNALGRASHYEWVFVAGERRKSVSVCVGTNTYTESDPFISGLELVELGDSLYNSTNFTTSGLGLVARHNFGYDGPVIRYPDDQYDRFWGPFGGNGSAVPSYRDVVVSGFWNLPPVKVFETELSAANLQPLSLQWPPVSLDQSEYYIALYFADDRGSSVEGSRIIHITINGVTYYDRLNVTSEGVVVFTSKWPLVGRTEINLTAASGSSYGPLINAGEIFQLIPLGRRTHTRDVTNLKKVKKEFRNPPPDWSGDPCFPEQYAWTGVTCSEGTRNRVVALDLTGMNISGTLSPAVAELTALTDIRLGSNKLWGAIPDLIPPLKNLQTLHLDNNDFSGHIPASLGDLGNLRELFLQNNNLTGQVPGSLVGKPGLNLQVYGNHLAAPPPS